MARERSAREAPEAERDGAPVASRSRSGCEKCAQRIFLRKPRCSGGAREAMNDVGLAWQREPVVLAIAHALLDLIDQGPKERIRAPRLRLQAENVPGLFSGSARESDYQWSLVQKMEQARWITIVTDRHPPGEPGYYRQARAVLCDEHALRELTGRALSDAPNWQDRFMQALGTRLPADHPALAEAMRFPLPLRAYDPEVVADRLLSVGALLDTPLLLREVASQLFFAQSKALDGKASLIAALLGLPECPFPDMPLHLAVALPAQPFNGVLFIENLTAFDSVGHRRSASTATLALVYASGYRCSARRLRMKDGASVYFSASSLPSEAKAAAFSTWLIRGGAELPVFFYGDLDFAGMS